MSPTLNVNPTIIVISCHFGGIIDSQCSNYYHLPSDLSFECQPSMTIFHHKLQTREYRVLANGGTNPSSKTIFVTYSQKCHPNSYHSDIKYHMTLHIIFSVLLLLHCLDSPNNKVTLLQFVLHLRQHSPRAYIHDVSYIIILVNYIGNEESSTWSSSLVLNARANHGHVRAKCTSENGNMKGNICLVY